MKKLMPGTSIRVLCGLFGKTPQAYYKRVKYQKVKNSLEDQIIQIVNHYRKDMKRVGTVKLQHLINNGSWGANIGRDALYNLLRSRRMLVRKPRKYRPKLTDGNGQSIYPDLRKELKVDRINQLWCTDITYLELANPRNFCYLTCFCDEASHLIIGYELSRRMQSKDIVRGLQKAINSQLSSKELTFQHKLIIHSDRGSQFKSKLYKKITDQYQINRSMSAAGSSHENPVAERLNGILKNELMVKKRFLSIQDAEQCVSKAINIYNTKRPHLSCNLLTPQQAHNSYDGPLNKLWKQRVRKKLSTNFSNKKMQQPIPVIN